MRIYFAACDSNKPDGHNMGKDELMAVDKLIASLEGTPLLQGTAHLPPRGPLPPIAVYPSQDGNSFVLSGGLAKILLPRGRTTEEIVHPNLTKAPPSEQVAAGKTAKEWMGGFVDALKTKADNDVVVIAPTEVLHMLHGLLVPEPETPPKFPLNSVALLEGDWDAMEDKGLIYDPSPQQVRGPGGGGSSRGGMGR